jgi:hypothetical protein
MRCVLLPSSGRWRQYTPLKRRSTPMRLHGAASQKTLTSGNKLLVTCSEIKYGNSTRVFEQTIRFSLNNDGKF